MHCYCSIVHVLFSTITTHINDVREEKKIFCVQKKRTEKKKERKITCIFGSCSRQVVHSCQKARYGAIPVPGPINIIGLVESVGKWKLEALMILNIEKPFTTFYESFFQLLLKSVCFFLFLYQK